MTIEIERSTTGLAIGIDLDNDEWNQQLRDGNFNDWLNAAQYGVGFALRVARVSDAHVVVRQIIGLEAYTNPTTVAAAAADATWKAIGFNPTDLLVRHIEEVTIAGCKSPWQLVQFEFGLPQDFGFFNSSRPN